MTPLRLLLPFLHFLPACNGLLQLSLHRYELAFLVRIFANVCNLILCFILPPDCCEGQGIEVVRLHDMEEKSGGDVPPRVG